MELETILQELTTLTPGEFPRAALEAAIAQQEAITPHLLRSLEDAPQLLERMVAEEDYMLPFYAFYLLAQFREQRAYPLIMDFFSIPGEAPPDVTGDFVTEDLGRVLASVSGGDIAPMQRLAENRQVNGYTRAAALNGIVTLVVEGHLARETAIAYFRSLFQTGLARTYSFIWDALVGRSTALYPEDLLAEIQQAFADDLIDELFIDLSWVEHVLAEGKTAALARLQQDRHYHFIKDTVSEMEWWTCFQPPPPPVIFPKLAPLPITAPEPLPPVITPQLASPPAPKVGCNALCPCGSGKKYKHCCGKPG